MLNRTEMDTERMRRSQKVGLMEFGGRTYEVISENGVFWGRVIDRHKKTKTQRKARRIERRHRK